ncbi:MAG: hypothetical protein RIQ93_619 [Verrucomicrobiota bacterium]|jgi:hypothetical protein
MTSLHLTRRLHLYFGLALLPWLLMYGLSSIPIAHNQFFADRDAAKDLPLWTVRMERPFDAPVPRDQEKLREFGRAALAATGVTAPNFGVFSPNPTTVNIQSFSFLKTTRLVYRIDQQKITVEDRRFRFDQFLTGLHTRGGFEQDGFLPDAWAVVIDLVCLAIILWIATGVFMWHRMTRKRLWGWVALLAGAGSFAVFALKL